MKIAAAAADSSKILATEPTGSAVEAKMEDQHTPAGSGRETEA
jgi:hypothetical protein